MKSVLLTDGYSFVCHIEQKTDAMKISFRKSINKMGLKPFNLLTTIGH